MSDIYAAAERHRAALIREESAASTRMVAAYRTAQAEILAELEKLLRKIAEARAGGDLVSASWLRRANRLEALLGQVEESVGRFARFAAIEIREQQRRAVFQAQRDAYDQVGTVRPVPLTWSRLPESAFTELVGFLADGSPLAARLAELAPETSAEISAALLRGLAIGRSPAAIARDVRNVSDLGLTRARTIARTEILRAYRESSRRAYLANTDTVDGWLWVAGLSSRCCAMCAALHGKEFPLDEPMATHPNCRCVMIPILRSITQELPETGEAWLADQPQAVQDQVLGSRAAGEAFRAGEVELGDFIGSRRSRRWGLTRFARSLKSIRDES